MSAAGGISLTTAVPPRTPTHVEWPTLGVAAALAVGFGVVLAAGDAVPVAARLAALTVLGAWYGSLQHEVTHGHPTPWPRINAALASLPLCIVHPFWHYRDRHIRHHVDADLTDPRRDPESAYLTAQDWERAGRVTQAVRQMNTTLLGRMIWGPLLYTGAVVRDLAARFGRGEDRARVLRHVGGVVVVLVAVDRLGVPWWQWLLAVGYGGTALTMVRSYAEHRAVPVGSRTAVVAANRFWSLLYLNNNLHVTHHRYPGAAWYRLPDLHRSSDADEVARTGAGWYRGYGEIFRRFLLHPRCQPIDPLHR